ncbi:methyltransferase 12 domain-containing protein [Citrus sinensis]|uniref:Methyltransferase 12 domain-containing protein n=1 Tax=Citrus sinensis TaxID=2711 RepID=A0ACB8J725_CITSI|nr:methyltransferase 12 domain-containing protein [Citrus sinensis]
MKVVSLSATYPYPSSLISITTVQRRHRHSLPAAIQPQNYPLEEHYQRKAKKYWDGFYKRHKNKFFKDRHYLEKDWGNYFSDDSCCPNGNPKVVLESHSEFREERVNAFVCNVVNDDLSRNVNPSSVDVVTLPDGYILVRDYAIGDFAQVKLLDRNQMIGDSFYVRGDGTCSFYFSEDFLSTLFLEAGFSTVDINIHLKQIKNRSQDITMNR